MNLLDKKEQRRQAEDKTTKLVYTKQLGISILDNLSQLEETKSARIAQRLEHIPKAIRDLYKAEDELNLYVELLKTNTAHLTILQIQFNTNKLHLERAYGSGILNDLALNLG